MDKALIILMLAVVALGCENGNLLIAPGDVPSALEFADILAELVAGSGLFEGQIEASASPADNSAARRWAGKVDLPLVCVLKGAGTVVTDGRRVWVNDTGNPGMATGGSGDILTGLLAALIAQGLAPFDAACLAARLHGRAGDLAAAELGEVSLTADDLLDYLPAALREIA